MVVTGGLLKSSTRFHYTIVSRYGKDGWIEDLSELNTARIDHGCSSFLSTDFERVRQNIIQPQPAVTKNVGVAGHWGKGHLLQVPCLD